MNKLLNAIKTASNQSVDESKPTGLFFGEVVSVAPLTVNVEQRLILTEEFLTLTHAVKDYYVDITVSHNTEKIELKHGHEFHTEYENVDKHIHPTPAGASGCADDTNHRHKCVVSEMNGQTEHKHKYKGKKKIMLHHGLKIGEQVMLLRVQGGQNYVIIDRVNDPICEGEWLDDTFD